MNGLLQQQPQQQQPQQGQEPDDVDDSTDHPAFQQAMQLAYSALYEQNAGKNVAASIQKAQSKPEALAHVAYEMASIAVERTEDFPEDYLVLLGSQLLSEVAEIAEAGGVELQPADVGDAFKLMVLRMLGEAGVDTTQLQQALEQYTPEMMDKVYEYAGQEEQGAEQEARQPEQQEV